MGVVERRLRSGIAWLLVLATTACAPRYVREADEPSERAVRSYPELPQAYATMTRDFLTRVRVKPGTVVCPALEGAANGPVVVEAAIVGELTRAGLRVLRLARQDAPFPSATVFTEAELSAQGRVKQLAQQGVERLLMITPLPGESRDPDQPRAYFRWVEASSGLTEIVEVLQVEPLPASLSVRVVARPPAVSKVQVGASDAPRASSLDGWKLAIACVGLVTGVAGVASAFYFQEPGRSPHWWSESSSWLLAGAGLISGGLAGLSLFDDMNRSASGSVTP